MTDQPATWTDDRIAVLVKRWTENASGEQIARELGGVSRCAVIGKANRLGLSKPPKERKSPPRRVRPSRPKAVPSADIAASVIPKPDVSPSPDARAMPGGGGGENAIARLTVTPISLAQASPAPTSPAPTSPAPTGAAPDGVTIDDLPDRACKMIVAEVPEALYCGMPLPRGRSWCDHHAEGLYRLSAAEADDGGHAPVSRRRAPLALVP